MSGLGALEMSGVACFAAVSTSSMLICSSANVCSKFKGRRIPRPLKQPDYIPGAPTVRAGPDQVTAVIDGQKVSGIADIGFDGEILLCAEREGQYRPAIALCGAQVKCKGNTLLIQQQQDLARDVELTFYSNHLAEQWEDKLKPCEELCSPYARIDQLRTCILQQQQQIKGLRETVHHLEDAKEKTSVDLAFFKTRCDQLQTEGITKEDHCKIRKHRTEVDEMHGHLIKRLSFLEEQIPEKHRALDELHTTLHSRLLEVESRELPGAPAPTQEATAYGNQRLQVDLQKAVSQQKQVEVYAQQLAGKVERLESQNQPNKIADTYGVTIQRTRQKAMEMENKADELETRLRQLEQGQQTSEKTIEVERHARFLETRLAELEQAAPMKVEQVAPMQVERALPMQPEQVDIFTPLPTQEQPPMQPEQSNRGFQLMPEPTLELSNKLQEAESKHAQLLAIVDELEVRLAGAESTGPVTGMVPEEEHMLLQQKLQEMVSKEQHMQLQQKLQEMIPQEEHMELQQKLQDMISREEDFSLRQNLQGTVSEEEYMKLKQELQAMVSGENLQGTVSEEEYMKLKQEVQGMVSEEEHLQLQQRLQGMVSEEEHMQLHQKLQGMVSEEEHMQLQQKFQGMVPEEEYIQLQQKLQGMVSEEEYTQLEMLLQEAKVQASTAIAAMVPEEEHTQLQQNFQAYEAQTNAKMDQQSMELMQQDTTISSLISQKEELQLEYNQLGAHLETVQHELDREKEARQELEEMLAKPQSPVQDPQVPLLQQDLELVEAKVTDVEKERNLAQTQVHTLEQELQELRLQCVEQARQLDSQSMQLDSQSLQLENQNQMLESLRDADQKLRGLEENFGGLQEEKLNADRRMREQEMSKDTMEKELQVMDMALTSLEEEKRKVESKAAEMERSKEMMARQLQAMNEQVQVFERKVRDMEVSREMMTQEFENELIATQQRHTEELVATQQRHTAEVQQWQGLQADRDRHLNRVRDLEQGMQGLQVDRDMHVSRVQDLEEDFRGLQADRDAHYSRSQSLEQERLSLLSQMELFSEKHGQLEQASAGHAAETSAQIFELRQKIMDAEVEHAGLQAKVDSSEKAKVYANERVLNMEELLSAEKQKYSELQREMQELQAATRTRDFETQEMQVTTRSKELEVAELAESLQTKERLMAEMRESAWEKDKTIRQLQDEQTMFDSERSTFANEIDSLRTAYDDLKSQSLYNGSLQSNIQRTPPATSIFGDVQEDQHTVISKLTEQNNDLKDQLENTWKKINDQNTRIEEDRKSFWQDFDEVRSKSSEKPVVQSATPIKPAQVFSAGVQPQSAVVQPPIVNSPQTSPLFPFGAYRPPARTSSPAPTRVDYLLSSQESVLSGTRSPGTFNAAGSLNTTGSFNPMGSFGSRSSAAVVVRSPAASEGNAARVIQTVPAVPAGTAAPARVIVSAAPFSPPPVFSARSTVSSGNIRPVSPASNIRAISPSAHVRQISPSGHVRPGSPAGHVRPGSPVLVSTVRSLPGTFDIATPPVRYL